MTNTLTSDAEATINQIKEIAREIDGIDQKLQGEAWSDDFKIADIVATATRLMKDQLDDKFYALDEETGADTETFFKDQLGEVQHMAELRISLNRQFLLIREYMGKI